MFEAEVEAMQQYNDLRLRVSDRTRIVPVIATATRRFKSFADGFRTSNERAMKALPKDKDSDDERRLIAIQEFRTRSLVTEVHLRAKAAETYLNSAIPFRSTLQGYAMPDDLIPFITTYDHTLGHLIPLMVAERRGESTVDINAVLNDLGVYRLINTIVESHSVKSGVDLVEVAQDSISKEDSLGKVRDQISGVLGLGRLLPKVLPVIYVPDFVMGGASQSVKLWKAAGGK